MNHNSERPVVLIKFTKISSPFAFQGGIHTSQEFNSAHLIHFIERHCREYKIPKKINFSPIL